MIEEEFKEFRSSQYHTLGQGDENQGGRAPRGGASIRDDVLR